MTLVAVKLDERTQRGGSDARRAEWDAIIREFLADPQCNLDEPATLCVESEERRFMLSFVAADGRTLGQVPIDHDLLEELVLEYLDIVRQMTGADGLNQMEALDMAKKVTHDRVGRLIKRELRELGFDLETSRRLFTLLLSIKVDTTRLRGVRGHRRPR